MSFHLPAISSWPYFVFVEVKHFYIFLIKRFKESKFNIKKIKNKNIGRRLEHAASLDRKLIDVQS